MPLFDRHWPKVGDYIIPDADKEKDPNRVLWKVIADEGTTFVITRSKPTYRNKTTQRRIAASSETALRFIYATKEEVLLAGLLGEL